ncbi:aldolase/citrate lyase family protein [Aurantimonas sp. VKM B-3413]|uniref:aldolase/citrate lyase family protein n=1 Tax=Aurantimonas sp. VKM B-3413 TaxID=2779401 RepID=UPI001E3E1B94|nr:aldolase/citrate lyase family protein [Aurantimonas sp. VKM B-3413]MCB8838905.1 hypothetical protein [Aurantimonas sp. VKM B-3413]
MDRSYGEAFVLTFITNDRFQAAAADAAGVDRVGVDLETLGKSVRQSGLDTRLSYHSISDLQRVSQVLSRSDAFVRINPINSQSDQEIESVLEAGAKVIMLPYFTSPTEVAHFIDLVRARARTILLVETKPALERIDKILDIPGVDEIMAGLNDLRIQLRLRSHFEVLVSEALSRLARAVNDAGLPFSVGGLARPDDGNLPYPPDLVIAQYPRLDASGAWLSRSFFKDTPADWNMEESIAKLRRRLTVWSQAGPDSWIGARDRLARLVG